MSGHWARGYLGLAGADQNGGNGGGGGGGLVVTETIDMQAMTATLDKTYQEIYNAAMAGVNVVLQREDPEGQYSLHALSAYGLDGDAYFVVFGEETYLTESVTGYPVSEG